MKIETRQKADWSFPSSLPCKMGNGNRKIAERNWFTSMEGLKQRGFAIILPQTGLWGIWALISLILIDKQLSFLMGTWNFSIMDH